MQPVSTAARPIFYTSPRRKPRPPSPTCTKPKSTAVSSTCQSYSRAEKSRPLPHKPVAGPAVPRRTSGPVFLVPRQAEDLQAAVEVAATVIVPITTGRGPCRALAHGLPSQPPAVAVDTDLGRRRLTHRDPVPGHHPLLVAAETTGAAATLEGAAVTTATEIGGEVPVAIAMPATTKAAAAAGSGDRRST